VGRQERVKTCQGNVNTGSTAPDRVLNLRVIENVIGGIIAIGLVAYLVYALARPDRF
jgi:K+-transporting ATPase KdpF subunit